MLILRYKTFDICKFIYNRDKCSPHNNSNNILFIHYLFNEGISSVDNLTYHSKGSQISVSWERPPKSDLCQLRYEMKIDNNPKIILNETYHEFTSHCGDLDIIVSPIADDIATNTKDITVRGESCKYFSDCLNNLEK